MSLVKVAAIQLDCVADPQANLAHAEKLVRKAEECSRSPEFLRQIILNGSKRGQSALALAKSTGLSLDEVELILAQQEPQG